MQTLDFKKEVLDQSYHKPVVVDFWAAWCGPCKVLGPVIEQIAEDQKDNWVLVKVDTEVNQAIAQQYNIRSIPNVKMFYNGEVIAEFAGAYPRGMILKWLEDNLPDARKQNLEALLSDLNKNSENLSKLEQFVKANPDIKEAALALAKHLVFTQPEKALGLVENIHLGDKLYEDAEDVRVLAQLMTFDDDGSPAAQKLTQAQESIHNQDFETAIQQVIEATTVDKNFNDDLPRKAAIALFRMWGPVHPLTQAYRWKFDMALY